jgi:hypothetical protein
MKAFCFVNALVAAVATVLSPASAQLSDAQAIERVKNTIVREIDSTLPDKTLETWLRDVFGTDPKTTWEVNDCGEQTGDPAVDRNRDIPLCVGVAVTLSGQRVLHIQLAVGTVKTGFRREPPTFFHGVVVNADKAPLQWFKSLGATATVQKIPESDGWGEPVDGVQLKLAVSATASPVPGEMPLLEVQLRNQGMAPMTFIGEALIHPEIEIDGVWYVQAWAGSCCSAPRQVAPGGTSELLRLRVIPAQTFNVNAKPTRTLALEPGKHSVRVRTASRESFYVQVAGSRRIVLTSNMVTLEVAPRTR